MYKSQKYYLVLDCPRPKITNCLKNATTSLAVWDVHRVLRSQSWTKGWQSQKITKLISNECSRLFTELHLMWVPSRGHNGTLYIFLLYRWLFKWNNPREGKWHPFSDLNDRTWVLGQKTWNGNRKEEGKKFIYIAFRSPSSPCLTRTCPARWRRPLNLFSKTLLHTLSMRAGRDDAP